jgi:hypothetical protein
LKTINDIISVKHEFGVVARRPQADVAIPR